VYSSTNSRHASAESPFRSRASRLALVEGVFPGEPLVVEALMAKPLCAHSSRGAFSNQSAFFIRR
jgi:hypothetical protein